MSRYYVRQGQNSMSDRWAIFDDWTGIVARDPVTGVLGWFYSRTVARRTAEEWERISADQA